ncbi:HNH endonuclease [Streptomyces olivaceus]|uniref:HNH endonuclease n=1 Tax=Streptomyces olivaceus TaxID=47716 RepID=UPI001CCDE846|nr:HNH endonuclease [Streptomyces olivaceus]MBZ6142525.1 HNH endonuclease [Streptomyces olivaceus]MBZ6170106.1 HNH endonuclease [Streptomyces olivaceus]
MTGEDVRYRSGGDNSILKMVLLKQWQNRCYMCGRPKDFTDTQIDHLIPQSSSPAELRDSKKQYSLTSSFDLHGPENLAPICSKCNLEKSNQTFEGAGAMLMALNKAAKLRPDVIAACKKFGSGTRLSNHLLRSIAADLTQKKSREAFETHAPAIVQKLALLDENKADYVTYHEVSIDDLHPDNFHDVFIPDVGLSLRNRGRTAMSILRDVCGCQLTELLQPRVYDLIELLQKQVHLDFESITELPRTNAGPAELLHLQVTIETIDYHRYEPVLEFTFRGIFDAYLMASLVQDALNGDGIQDRQGEAAVTGSFSFTADWLISAQRGALDISDCTIEEWSSHLEVT